MEMPTLNIDLEDFAKWVESRSPWLYWQRRNPAGCPIAGYLKEQHECTVHVCEDQVYVCGRFHRLPEWAQRFVAFLDADEEGEIVRKYQVLELLELVRDVKEEQRV